MTSSTDRLFVRVLAVIVLYKMRPGESAALATLRAAISSLQNGKACIKILLYDNTPGGLSADELLSDVQYKADPDNGGLAKAYNYALEVACEEGFDWLLTLDQDTSLPPDFLCKLSDVARLVAPMNNVAAIVPFVVGDGRPISPSAPVKHWALTKWFPKEFVGVSMETLTLAVNSGATLKVKTLKGIGGFDPRFWLDFSDVAMYFRLYLNNLQVYVAGNIVVEHELSVFDLMNRTTPGRYDAIRRAEEAFYDAYLGKAEGMVLLLRLVYRLAYTLWKAGATLPYFRVGSRYLLRRLFWSRARRLENWRLSAMPKSVV